MAVSEVTSSDNTVAYLKEICGAVVRTRASLGHNSKIVTAVENAFAEFTKESTLCPHSLRISLDVALHGETDLWDIVEPCFGKPLTFDDFKRSTPSGVTLAHWFFRQYKLSRDTLKWFTNAFGEQLTLDELLRRDKDVPLLWLTLGTGAWPWIEKRFGNQLSLQDFEKKGLELALDSHLGFKSDGWNFIGKLFYAQLCGAQHVTSEVDPDGWICTCLILNNCEGTTLRCFWERDFYKQIFSPIKRLNSSIEANSIEQEQLREEIQNLLNAAYERNESEGYFFIAKFLLAKHGWLAEAFTCYRMVQQTSIFYEEAQLNMAHALLTGQYDKDGNQLEGDNTHQAKRRAFKEALKMLCITPRFKKYIPEFRDVKRQCVALLLEDTNDRKEFAWADDETDLAILLQQVRERVFAKNIENVARNR